MRKIFTFLLALVASVGMSWAETITVTPSEHGSVVASSSSATAGETITLTATPDEGYQLKSISGVYVAQAPSSETLNSVGGETTVTGTEFQCVGTISANGYGWRVYNPGTANTLTVSSNDGATLIEKIELTSTWGNSRQNNMLSVSAGTLSFDGSNPSTTVTINNINATSVTISGSGNNAGKTWCISSVKIYYTGTIENELEISDTENANVKTFTMVDSEVTISAEFEPAPAPAEETTTVTWNSSTISSIGLLVEGQSFTKDGVTLTALNGGIIDEEYGHWSGNSDGTAFKFSTSLGNFTKIEITADIYVLGGSGWTETSPGTVWTGDANETTCGGYFENVSQIVFTIEPAATPEPEPAEDVNITPNADPENPTVYYSTFFDSANKYALPAGVEAYVAEVSSNALNLTKIAGEGQTIPAGNAVILKSTVANFTLAVSDAAAVSFTANNSLEGVDVATTVTDIAGLTANNCYVLSGGSEDETVTGVGFYLIYGTTLLAHKAYVQYNATSGAPKRMRFVFPQEQMPTGIDETNTADKAQKVMENGTLYIIREGVRYNAAGQRAQ